MRKIELLAPAKNAEIGIEAIRHGADAVYIGPPAFGARAAAGNSIEDIKRLCDFAHLFGAAVYITFNTILYDNELVEAERMIQQLYEVGVDALIVQDLSLLKMALPPIALHSSTQMDMTNVEKALFIEKMGFSQIVLARESSIDEIRKFYDAVNIPLEGFIHGALCVSYSGRCYVSEACFGRSANRGRCAQFCRLSFDLIDATGRIIEKDKHLLSLQDMNRSASIEEMMDAGISSFKIEGRLKDLNYVKNVTAFYRQAIDKVIDKRQNDYCRTSYGVSTYNFTPNLSKSFNRGFTEYFLHGRSKVHNFSTPKARGEFVGTVERSNRDAFYLEEDVNIAAGDGLCFLNSFGKLEGFRINKIVNGAIFPGRSVRIPRGAKIFRNLDIKFDAMLQKNSAERKIQIEITFNETSEGFSITIADEQGHKIAKDFALEKTIANTPQRENIIKQLSKWGNTIFSVKTFRFNTEEYFIPSSILSTWRREMEQLLIEEHQIKYQRPQRRQTAKDSTYYTQELDYTANVSNHLAKDFYAEHGVNHIAPAFEIKPPQSPTLMTCRHCIRYALGHCPQRHSSPLFWKEPLYLQSSDGKRFRLKFDCAKCEMQVLQS
ncbi:hypothetical protein HMPREF9332_00086 [Alloprevotella rava F0323]|uniref:Peptidase U32 collagenase domain-containing protein n=2 Tax=Alloprevotella rava TaxID=671218 RepID=G5G936_9BACT|nr:hypothetical protein HMPREF9332_00086 [Alloprevotella rava F0323]